MTKNKLQERDERFLLILPVLTALVGSLFIILTVRDLTITHEDVRGYFVASDLIVAAMILGLWIVLLRRKPSAKRAHVLGMFLFIGVAVKNLLMIFLMSEVIYATQTAVAVLAVGCVFLSVRWFVVTLAAIFSAWLVVTLISLGGTAVLQAGAPLLVALAISSLLLRNRIRFHTAQIFLEQRVEMLEHLLPVCASCKKVRTDEGEWAQIENYLADELDRAVAHMLCPDCRSAKTHARVKNGQANL